MGVEEYHTHSVWEARISFSLTWKVKGGKCGEGEFTPNPVLQNVGQSLRMPERGGRINSSSERKRDMKGGMVGVSSF